MISRTRGSIRPRPQPANKRHCRRDTREPHPTKCLFVITRTVGTGIRVLGVRARYCYDGAGEQLKQAAYLTYSRYLRERHSCKVYRVAVDAGFGCDELDKQIERVFTGTGEPIKQSSSGRDLITQLGQATPRLLCSLVHKFGRRDVDDFDAFIKELKSQPSQTIGEVFVFVDSATEHRGESSTRS